MVNFGNKNNKCIKKINNIMIYKYLFYSISYLVRKYDRFWNVGNSYFLYGGIWVGAMIGISLLNIINILGLLFNEKLFWIHYKPFIYLPLILGLLITAYFGYGKRYARVYKEMEKLEKSKKVIYKIINIIHIILVWGTFFQLSNIIRDIIN